MKNEKMFIFFMDKILPLLPITSLFMLTYILHDTNISWLIFILPILLTVTWNVWHEKFRPKFNIKDEKSFFQRVLDNYYNMV